MCQPASGSLLRMMSFLIFHLLILPVFLITGCSGGGWAIANNGDQDSDGDIDQTERDNRETDFETGEQYHDGDTEIDLEPEFDAEPEKSDYEREFSVAKLITDKPFTQELTNKHDLVSSGCSNNISSIIYYNINDDPDKPAVLAVSDAGVCRVYLKDENDVDKGSLDPEIFYDGEGSSNFIAALINR